MSLIVRTCVPAKGVIQVAAHPGVVVGEVGLHRLGWLHPALLPMFAPRFSWRCGVLQSDIWWQEYHICSLNYPHHMT